MSNVGNRFVEFILLIFGVVIIVGSIVLIIWPSLLTNNVGFIESPDIIAAKKVIEYKQNINLSVDEIIELEKNVKNDVKTPYNIMIRLAAVCLFVFALFLLYKRKRFKLMRKKIN